MFTPPESIPVRTPDRILTAARAVLARSGLDGFSMRAVAKQAGVSAGAIYRHFRDKNALVGRVVEQGFEHFERSLLESIVSLPVGSFARLAALGDAYIQFAAEHEEEFKVLFNPMATGRKRVKDLPGQGGYSILRRCIVEAMEDGAIRRGDPDLVAFYLWSRVHGIVMLLLSCDFTDEITVDGGAGASRLFGLTRGFVTAGLGAHA